MITKFKTHVLGLLLSVVFYSCNTIGIELPQGPQGNRGESAYEIWKNEVLAGRIEWPVNKIDVADFLVYIKGEKGDQGMSAYEQWKLLIAQGNIANPHVASQIWPATRNSEVDFWDFLCGRDGHTPHVGDNGNWWIGNSDTGVKAIGKDGVSAYEQWKGLVAENGIDWPKDQISQNDFFMYLKGKDGTNGITPHVGTNGNWYFGSTDTGIPAIGKDGKDGLSPRVGTDGNWYIGDTNTGISAKGKDGQDGLTPVIKEGYWWIGETNTEVAAQGVNGKDGKTPVIKEGNWWIGNTDTGVKAQGDRGNDGVSPHIGENGNWWIGKTDTKLSAKGQDGAAGASAYELWQKDVKAGKILNKEGKVWPEEKITMGDFYTYLSGANGANGKSAYELWKEKVAAGEVNDPKNEGQIWPTENIAENDFFNYLSGKDGVNGINGLSAYELWKNDLAKRSNTPEALINYRDGGIWDPVKNSLNDFYEYLRGKDGKNGEDGKDGKPGDPGKPGAEVTIIRGIPNVIAQYSQSEFGEYVRTTDGGVLYKVYDEMGEPAPRAKVKGMPGIHPDKIYTSDDKGEFLVPKEDLPELQDVNLRWGTVKEVTLEGKEPQLSAKNTYVPNRVHVRMILSSLPSLDYQQNIYYRIQRKMNPNDEWQNLPTYLPNSASRNMDAYRVLDKDKPESIIIEQKLISRSGTNSSSDGSHSYYIYVNRPVKENPAGLKNGYSKYWDSEVYFTLKAREPYYGEDYQWNGVSLLPMYQMGPVLKKLKLKGITTGEAPAFTSAEGELDFSKIDFTKIYKGSFKKEVRANGMDYIEPQLYTEAEARKLEMAFVKFKYTSTAGTQEASSSNNKSSVERPEFKVFTPFLNSSIYIDGSNCHFNTFTQGYLQRGTGSNTFVVKKYNDDYKIDEVEVIYEE